MMDKLKFNELIFILDEFLYNKMLDDNIKMDGILDFDYDILKEITIINNSRNTQLEYRFNMPITEKTEPFSFEILLCDEEYDIYNRSDDDLRYGDFDISNELFIDEIKNNIKHCYYLEEFMNKFIIWHCNTKTDMFYRESEDLYNLLLGYYKRKDVEQINNKYVFVKCLKHHC